MAAAVAAVFAVACEQATTSPPETTEFQPPAPNFNVGNGPSNPGPIVTRLSFPAGPQMLAFWSPNPLPTVAVYQIDNSVTAFGPVTCEAATVTFEPLEFQLLFKPNGVVQQLIQVPEAFVRVYDATGLPPFPFLDCAFLTGSRLMAYGIVHAILNDNDLAVSGTRTNAFSLKANGRLTLGVDGSTTNLSHKVQAQINKSSGFRILKDQIKLTPDPRL
jgi:hypothetical protein